MNAIERLDVINCNRIPHIPEGSTLVHHTEGGQIIWSGNATLLQSTQQARHGSVWGGHLCRLARVQRRIPLNACVLDYLMSHQDRIPERYKDYTVLFCGTEYRSPHGSIYVRGLHHSPYHGWIAQNYSKYRRWDSDYVALVL